MATRGDGEKTYYDQMVAKGQKNVSILLLIQARRAGNFLCVYGRPKEQFVIPSLLTPSLGSNSLLPVSFDSLQRYIILELH